MHLIPATPGGWTPDTQGVILITQNPAPIIILTAADTDLQTLAATLPYLPPQFPSIRAVNILQLQQELSIDTYTDTVLRKAKVIILRLLGGRSYWSYGLEVVKELGATHGVSLFILPGDDRPDPTLMSHSTVPFNAVHQLWQYLNQGGPENWLNGLKFVADLCLDTSYHPPLPIAIPRVGLYQPKSSLVPWEKNGKKFPPTKVGILFYRAHYLAGNTLPIEALIDALKQQHLEPVPVYISSLQDPETHPELLNYFQPRDGIPITVLLNTTSFSLAKIGQTETLGLWKQLNVPVIQVILSGGGELQWQNSWQGLSPRDVAMNVALPEVDGRIISRSISFKSVQTWHKDLEMEVVGYQPRLDRVQFVSHLTAAWVNLKETPIPQRKIALILPNYPNKDGRLANGVGLDTPASCVVILHALQQLGYHVNDLPVNPQALISLLTSGITNDPEGQELRPVFQSLTKAEYLTYFNTLPPQVQEGIITRWGEFNLSHIPISGIQLGNVFVGIQPSRGYDRDPSLNYHAPDLEPTHEYLGFYHWLRCQFQAQAIIHLGKHGNLEWLPGKSMALSNCCYPEIALGTIPHFYPFIVNDPGEGAQAKRRGHAVIIDHLTPPLTRAELYGDLQKLEGLIDEYYEAQTLNPGRLSVLADRILQLIKSSHLDRDLGLGELWEDQGETIAPLLNVADGYLCELKESQIRDGLHIFGECPEGRQLRDLTLAIARSPSYDRYGLTRALAEDLNLDFDPLTTPYTTPLPTPFQNCRTVGDAVEFLELKAARIVEDLIKGSTLFGVEQQENQTKLNQELIWIRDTLLPNLRQTPQEITSLMKGLNGEYIPSGASGAPTRGRPEVLPTGRNFYTVDIRAIPTETAWDVGRKAAELVIERYTQEQGEYPQNLALSLWGTSTMRTGGDDVAQALALMGVRPIWDGSIRRVIDFEILSLQELQRPRVDVTLRVSGFFRDSFPNLLDLMYQAIEAVSSLQEAPEDNPLAAKVDQETEFWQESGLGLEESQNRALYRIFSSKPGAYGAGLQGLIEAKNWQTDGDLAAAYINWSSYAYQGSNQVDRAPEALTKRLENLQIILHNQDNREHDLLDSDDYYQFQGGLTAAVRSLTGKNPLTYFGDNSIPSNPKIRLLKEEIARVYRARVINPKWLEGVMRHGYKGAFEMAATVDFLFAYDATANCVEDFMYEGIADNYLFNSKIQEFIRINNPWALRDMAERLLEAQQRNLWENVDQGMIDKLKLLVNEAEGEIEGKSINK